MDKANRSESRYQLTFTQLRNPEPDDDLSVAFAEAIYHAVINIAESRGIERDSYVYLSMEANTENTFKP